jgi:hypothetical protein
MRRKEAEDQPIDPSAFAALWLASDARESLSGVHIISVKPMIFEKCFERENTMSARSDDIHRSPGSIHRQLRGVTGTYRPSHHRCRNHNSNKTRQVELKQPPLASEFLLLRLKTQSETLQLVSTGSRALAREGP